MKEHSVHFRERSVYFTELSVHFRERSVRTRKSALSVSGNLTRQMPPQRMVHYACDVRFSWSEQGASHCQQRPCTLTRYPRAVSFRLSEQPIQTRLYYGIHLFNHFTSSIYSAVHPQPAEKPAEKPTEKPAGTSYITNLIRRNIDKSQLLLSRRHQIIGSQNAVLGANKTATRLPARI
jgi:hypothetical protein